MPREKLWSVGKKDLRIDTFRAGGKGGQHQNTADTGVRITHVETGLSAESREFKSQHQNKKSAFHKLAALLVKHFSPKNQRERYSNTEKIRTYHAVRDVVKDHASGFTQPYSVVVEKPHINDMVDARRKALLQGDTDEEAETNLPHNNA